MPNTKPPRNLTPVLCQQVQREMLKACQDVAARHGLVVEAQDITGVDLRWGFDAGPFNYLGSRRALEKRHCYKRRNDR
jgi:hypothetical protein